MNQGIFFWGGEGGMLKKKLFERHPSDIEYHFYYSVFLRFFSKESNCILPLNPLSLLPCNPICISAFVPDGKIQSWPLFSVFHTIHTQKATISHHRAQRLSISLISNDLVYFCHRSAIHSLLIDVGYRFGGLAGLRKSGFHIRFNKNWNNFGGLKGQKTSLFRI